MNRKDHINEAAVAHTDLNALGAVIAILEGGIVSNSTTGPYNTTKKIIRMCKKEIHRQLIRYEKSVERALRAKQ